MFRDATFPELAGSAATKEVARYRQALLVGFEAVRTSGLLTNNHILSIQAERAVLFDFRHSIREQHRFYSQDLINNLCSHPYTKIEFIQRDLNVSRLTATRYLDALTESGFLYRQKIGRSNYYINQPLYRILTDEDTQGAG